LHGEKNKSNKKKWLTKCSQYKKCSRHWRW
jgi:hypothetical protein